MTGSRWKGAMLAVSLIALMPEVAQAQSNAALQQQIDELKAQVQALTSALAASVFHSGAIAIPELKRYLRGQQIEVRDVY